MPNKSRNFFQILLVIISISHFSIAEHAGNAGGARPSDPAEGKVLSLDETRARLDGLKIHGDSHGKSILAFLDLSKLLGMKVLRGAEVVKLTNPQIYRSRVKFTSQLMTQKAVDLDGLAVCIELRLTITYDETVIEGGQEPAKVITDSKAEVLNHFAEDPKSCEKEAASLNKRP